MTQLEMLSKRVGNNFYAFYVASMGCPSDYRMRDIHPCNNKGFRKGCCYCIRCWLQEFKEVE